MINAKKEFLEHVGGRKVLCARVAFIAFRQCDEDQVASSHDLREGYSDEEYQAFLESLNKEYDNGYGCQELYGTIWYTNHSWSDRSEYDGSEWWTFQSCPKVPKELKNAKQGV